ncbi:uncharacterized protein LOC129741507 [Uranotaenia lowii]|uniref:uncharacterized protein LOC129741507 n=1 Tax=Uranotaenia lowii TaxID=190385 RepID=UPI0024785E06|nr:uncharacterized protein LOC129741507 [Uranotaenia lowii]
MARNLQSQLKTLQKRERQIVLMLDSVDRFLQHYNSEHDECQLTSRIQALDPVYSEFYEVRGKIEIALEEADEKLDKDLEEDTKKEAEKQRQDENERILLEFEDRFFELKGMLMKLQSSKASQPNDESRFSQDRSAPFSRVKLPEIRLPTFNGKIKEWVTFRDSFRSLIHCNPQLGSTEKFTYLRSAVTGDALKDIASIELTDANYDVAWDILEERYENRKLIVKAYLDALFALEPLKKEGYDGLNNLITEFEKNLQMLQKVDEETEGWSTILSYMLSARLDPVTLRNWETHHNSKEVPRYEDLKKFLRNYCSVLQSVAPSKGSSSTDNKQSRSSVCNTAYKSSNRCPFCNEPWHSPFHCQKFMRLKLSERLDAVNRARVCRNCFQSGHFAANCSRSTCRHCHQKHHSLIHASRSSVPHPLNPKPYQQSTSQPIVQQASFQQPNPQLQPTNTENLHTSTQNAPTTSQHTNTQQTSTHSNTSQNYVALPASPSNNIILSTALIRVKDRHGNTLIARALLDSCSQHCLMTRDFSRKLRFVESPTFLSVQGIGSSQSVSTKAVSAEITPRSPKMSRFQETVQFFVLPKLTLHLPTTSFDPSTLPLPDASLLADPYFHESRRIDVIIGAEYYMDLLTNDRRKITANGPTLQKTVFGWIVSGRVSSATPSISQTYVCSIVDLQDQLMKFWELETCRVKSVLSIEESLCEKIFRETTIRDTEGRFVVTLPKKESVIDQIGNSLTRAASRFTALERRFETDADLKKLYAAFVHEYLALGHMQEVSDKSDLEKGYYIPHLPVFKPDSTTTKLRVVFDASCKSSSGVSLNDALMVGPVVQDELLDITLRFRLHQYAIVADIAKMYRMIKVQRGDHRWQRILWRDSRDESVRTFELNTVTYGTSSAPYLATRCLQQLSQDGAEEYPIAAEVLASAFYVDDMLISVKSIEEGKQLVQQMMSLMDSAGMSLRKYVSNCSEILQNVPSHLCDERLVCELDSTRSTVKTLGLQWQPSSDDFRFSTISWDDKAPITKRKVLSDVARLFDPLGLVGPVVIQAKIFVQDLWKLQCDWDEELSVELQEQWREYRRNFASLDTNRVSEIQHITVAGTWNHVAGVENPADIISRGMIPAQLQYQSLWFQGPSWLRLEEKHWPQNVNVVEESLEKSSLEEKASTTAVAQVVEPSEVFRWRSSYIELMRLVAWMRRFRFNSQIAHRDIKRSGALTLTELDESLKTLVRIAQKESFPKEYCDLKNNRPISPSSKLMTLTPEMVDGLIRIGGRLRHASISDNRKHPYILDHRHPFTETVMTYYHRKLFHAGQQLLIAAVRDQFWPTHIGTLARSVIFKCVPCFRVKPKIQEQIMADLPVERVTQCPVFERVGVDYCGPFFVTYPQRKCRPVKVFIAIYVCLVTKAVHMEVASDLSTQGFLATFQRFCSRRGAPRLVMCDNAKNFVGAKRVLDEVHGLFISKQFQNTVVDYAANQGIEFHFIPARSPNFGGLWESAVKSFKTLLKRTVGQRSLGHEEFQTIVVKIEAALNSRPITELSNDPDDFEPLTPGHFLVQKKMTALPERDLKDVPESRLKVWQRMEQISQNLWAKWSTQYLSNLNNRTKWTKKKDNIKIGTLVILKEENFPPLQWPMARVVDLHPGTDGNIRVVTVRTQNGTYKRGISKICVLPIRDNLQSSEEENLDSSTGGDQ